jgi:hypothetical protein
MHWALQEWNAINDSSLSRPQIYKEFFANSDWFHISEGSGLHDGVADPTIPKRTQCDHEICRLLLNEDRETANDPKY